MNQNKFWAAGSSSSEESDSDDSYTSSEESVGKGQNRWVDLSDDSESEDEVRRVVSAKDRSLEALQAHIAAIRNAMKIRDFNKIQSEFDNLIKTMAKAKKLLSQGIPRPLVRLLVDLDDFVKASLADKAAFKKLSASNGRALNRMKLTLRKHNKPYEAVMQEYRKNPIVSSSSSSSEADSSSDESSSDDDSDNDSDSSSSSSSDDSSAAPAKEKAAAAAVSDSDSDSDDSDSDDEDSSDDDDDDESEDWGSDSDSSSSSEDSDDRGELVGRARWLKKTPTVTKKVIKNKEERILERQKRKAAQEKAALLLQQEGGSTKLILPQETLTAAVLQRKVKEVVASRGRKGTDNRTILRQLEAMSRMAPVFGPRVEIPILMNVVTAQFDLQRTLDDYMETPMWNACASYLDRITTVLDEGWTLGVASVEEEPSTPKNKMKAAAMASADEGAMAVVAADEKLINPHTGEAETEDERAERIRVEAEANMTDEEKRMIPVMGSLSLFLSRLEEEYIKSLQHISPHSPAYVMRLRDEAKLLNLLERVQKYYERIGSPEEAAVMAQLRVEHLYYRHDSIARKVDRAAAFYKKYGETDMLHPSCITAEAGEGGETDFTKSHPGAVLGKPAFDEDDQDAVDFSQLMSDLCTYIYQHGTDRAKTRAMICHVYHHALHDRFLEARDLLLMSHLQDTIANVGDVSTMILFNRMMVTLGMAAFRLGRIWDAHQCLSEICSGRVRELLAQGVSTGRFNDKSDEQAKAEKRRQVPYHQHINLDLLEACHLISAMLLEVPNMAAALVDGDAGSTRRARVISRTFRKHHDIYDRQVFTGPPEQTRDFVMKASKALMKGDWKTCADLLTNLDVWKLVPGDNAEEEIAAMLTQKIKLEGLRTYLFAFSSQYDSLSLSQLCALFDMTKNEVHSVVSKMMINRELYASWDQPTETIVLRRVEPTSLQVMALQFAEKAASLVEANERLLDARSGSYGYKDDHWKGAESGGYYRGNRSGTGGYSMGGRGGNRSGVRVGGRGSSGRGSGGYRRGSSGGGRGSGGGYRGRSNRY